MIVDRDEGDRGEREGVEERFERVRRPHVQPMQHLIVDRGVGGISERRDHRRDLARVLHLPPDVIPVGEVDGVELGRDPGGGELAVEVEQGEVALE